MITKIANGRVVCEDTVAENAAVYFSDGKILGVFEEGDPFAPTADHIIDAKGRYVSPGFIDIHTHGGGGADFLDGEEDGYLKAAGLHAAHGTTSLVPTTTSGNYEELLDTFSVYKKAAARQAVGADFIGMHLEGPYFSPSQKGAQDENYIRPFDSAEYTKILEAGRGVIVRWSAAPEISGASEFAAVCRRYGVLPCMGHTDAEYEDAAEAFAAGFTHVTHLYSCTSTVHRVNAYRHAGVVECAYLTDAMTVEIIADGSHLPPQLLRLVYKIKGADRTALITDSMRGAGMPEGESILGSKKNGLRVIIEDGVAKMPDRTCFAGSVATTDLLVRNMVKKAQAPLTDAVKMASATPARIIGNTRKGLLAPGFDADIVLFDEDIRVSRTIVRGNTVFGE